MHGTKLCRVIQTLVLTAVIAPSAFAQGSLPIADAHVHYSHDSVELTPPARVIELMRDANLKFALVSSSDDNGTRLLSELAPDLIIPGLRPYRRRGELSTWFNDPAALEYVERLLTENRYATIGEFHLYGSDAELDIPRRIVKLAEKHNLVLHAHSDADAVERLLKQSDSVKVLWAHSGFDAPADIATMLGKHDRLWADLAFRSEVGSGGSLSDDWRELFEKYPDRLMLGTDTYTPERIYYIPENANSARVWLATLPDDLATNIAWRNAHNLLMPIWNKNRSVKKTTDDSSDAVAGNKLLCPVSPANNEQSIDGEHFSAVLAPVGKIEVSQPFSVILTLCGSDAADAKVTIDAIMPAHGHGMNYNPELNLIAKDKTGARYEAKGLVFHMPGEWQWSVDVRHATAIEKLQSNFELQ